MKTRKVIQRHFRSITELDKYLKNETQPNFKDLERSLDKEGKGGSFFRTTSFEEANNLLLCGDKDLAQKIEDAGVKQMRLKLKAQHTRRQLFSSVVGVAPNVPNAIAGVPTAMIAYKEVKAKTKVLNIFYNMSISGGVGADEIITKSSKFISAAMLLEAQGVRLNIFAGDVAENNNTFTIFSTRIKSASQPFDVLKMCYPLAHSSMLRRHYFRAMEVTEGVTKGFVCGYGRVVSSEAFIREILDTKEKFNVVLSFADITNNTSTEDLAKLIIEKCK